VNTSLSFDATATSLLAPLCSGGGVSLLPEGPEELIALGSLLAERRRCSLVKLTPAHLDSLGRLEKDAVTNDAADALIIGGEALAAHQVEAWRERAPGTRLINEYGPTETTVGVVTYEIGEATPTSGPIPIGRPLANTRIYLLDRQRRPVPLGAVGEIYIGGAGVARGYLNRPEITAERFIASPFVPGDRLYKTGDLARYLPDGDLLFLGRSDQQVKIRGFRVELGEIEARLAEHGDVREVVVLAREEQSGDKRLVAYVVRAGGALADAGEPGDRAAALRAHLAGCLPDYMVPAAFVELDALPLTANGKVDHKALPAPGEDGYARRAYDPPQGDIEQTLASIWAELLGLEGIGRNDDLFDLGGHSLVAIRLINAIEYRLGIALPLRTVFEKRTLVQLADTLSTYRRHEDAASETEMARILEKIRLVRSTDAASMDTVDKS
jgi:acyl-coenzyme A synthetase/AMP-(fatty) acid ligase/acyl carrier protein